MRERIMEVGGYCPFQNLMGERGDLLKGAFSAITFLCNLPGVQILRVTVLTQAHGVAVEVRSMGTASPKSMFVRTWVK